MAAYIDLAYVNGLIDPSLVQRLFDDGAGYVPANFTIVANAATAKVRSRLTEAGYTPPDDLSDTSKISAEGADLVRLATFEVWKKLAFGRKLLPVEAETPNYKAIADELASGDADPEGMTPSPSSAVGGVSFSESSPTVEGSYFRVFPRDMER